MVIKAIVYSWIIFQVYYLIPWDTPELFRYGQVISQATGAEQEIFRDDIYAGFLEDNCTNLEDAAVLTACENCACSAGNARIALPQSTECVITEEVLAEIYDLILAAYLKAITPPDSRGNSKRTFSEDDQGFCQNMTDMCRNSRESYQLGLFQSRARHNDPVCDQLIEDIKNVTALVTTEIELLIMSIFDPAGLLIKIAQLQNCVNCLRNNLADLVENAANETAKCYEDGLGRVYTCFTTELGKRTERILELEQRVSQKTFDVIAANVLAARYAKAAVEFKVLNNESYFDSIMEELFNSRQLEHILQFGYTLHHNNITGRYLVYDKINRLINQSMPDDIHNIVFRSFVVADKNNFCGSPNYCFELGLPLGFAKLMGDVIPRTNVTINTWAQRIRAGNFESYITFGSPEIVNLTGKAFHDAIDELVTISYDKNKANLDNTLNFVSALRWNNQSYTGFAALLRESGGVGVEDQLKIAIKMKVAMENLKGPDKEPDLVREKFEQLKASGLRDNVRAIVWADVCSLQAVGVNNQYLFADNDQGLQIGNRRLKTKGSTDSTTEWTLERVERGKNEHEWRIKSKAYGEYLGPHVPWRYQNFGSPGYEFACTTNSDHVEPQRKHYNWQVKFEDLSGNDQIALFHVGRQAYLHAMSDGNVYLGMFGKTSANTRWRISCK